MEKEKILEVKDLKVSFQTFQGSVQAVRGVSWHLNKKETIAIVGESGCGKTVTIQTVIGLNPKKNGSIKGGEVLFNKENLLDLTPKQMRKLQGNQLSIIFQDPFTFLNPTMTVGEQIMEPYMQHYKVSREEARKKGDLKDDFTSVTRGKYEALSASAFRRYAPAYHDCNGTHL